MQGEPAAGSPDAGRGSRELVTSGDGADVRASAPSKPQAAPESICEAALGKLRAQDFYCQGELKRAPEDYGTSGLSSHLRYLPSDYSEADPRQAHGIAKRHDGTIWTGEFNHASSLSIGEVQKQLPKPEKLKDLVRYKGPASQKTVLKQAVTNAELQKAIENEDPDMVAALLRFGLQKRCVNVDAPLWPKRECMLHLAARRNLRDICIMLLEAKADIHAEEITDGRQPLHDACQSGSYDTAELLLDKKARIEENTFTGMRPLHWAAQNGHADVVDLLLDRRARIDAATGSTWEPIHYAASGGHAEVVRVLCKRAANADAETSNGQRPIQLACLSGHASAAVALMDFGARGVLGEFSAGTGPLLKWRGSRLEEQLRRAEELRFQQDEAEELCDMGQQEEAEEAFRRVYGGFEELGMSVAAAATRSQAERCGVTIEAISQ